MHRDYVTNEIANKGTLRLMLSAADKVPYFII